MQKVLETGADYGVALDGDADRLQLVDADGRLFNGDELLYVMVADRLARGQAVPGVVGTLMTNMAVELALRELGVELVRAKVGDRYVPVVCLSSVSRWPEPSPPSSQPRAASSSRT